jgi:hypothetical protein
VIFDRCVVIRERGFSLIVKAANIVVSPKCLDTNYPYLVALMSIDALVFRTGLFMLFTLIEMVLTAINQTQIAAPVIKPVSVDVVDFNVSPGVQNYPMHQDCLLNAASFYSASSVLQTTAFLDTPTVLTQGGIIHIVHNC